jgi:hypothetical protein
MDSPQNNVGRIFSYFTLPDKWIISIKTMPFIGFSNGKIQLAGKVQ